MKANVVRGGGFKGALLYGFGKDEGRIVGGNMSNSTVKSLTAEFMASTVLRPDIEKAVLHISLSAAPNERLSDEKWGDVAAEFLRLMKIGPNHQFVVIKHTALSDQVNPKPGEKGPEQEHVHIYVSRIGLDANVWAGQFELLNAIEATQKLEKRFDLVQTPGLESKPDRRTPTKPEIEKAIRTGIKPPRMVIQDALAAAINKDGPTPVIEFIKRAQAAGVEVKPNISSTGRMNGFSFGFDGLWFTGQKIGAGFTWSKLQAKGVEYEQTRDFEELAELCGKTVTDASARASAAADDAARRRADELADANARSESARAADQRARDDAAKVPQSAGTAKEQAASAGARDSNASPASSVPSRSAGFDSEQRDTYRALGEKAAAAASKSGPSGFGKMRTVIFSMGDDERGTVAQAQREIDQREKFRSLAEALWAWLDRIFRRVAPQRAQQLASSTAAAAARPAAAGDIPHRLDISNDAFFKDERIQKLRDDFERLSSGKATARLTLDSVLKRAIELDDADVVKLALESGAPVNASHFDAAAKKQDELLFKILVSAEGTLTNPEALRDMSSRCGPAAAQRLDALAAHAKQNDGFVDSLDMQNDFAAPSSAPSSGPAGPVGPSF